jgi:hypothetical protein
MLNIESRIEHLKDFLQNFKLKLKRLAKSEIFRISLAVILSVFLIFAITPLFFDNSALKFQVKQKVVEIFKLNLEIKGGVDVRFLPAPQLVLNEVLIEDFKPENQNLDSAKIYNLYAEKLIIKFSIFSNLNAVSKIIFENATLESYFDNEQSKVRDNKLQQKIISLKSGRQDNLVKVGKGVSGKIFNIVDAKKSDIPNIIFKNSEIIFYDFFARKNEIKNINLNLKINKKSILATGNFNSQEILSEFNFAAKFNKKIGSNSTNFNLKSPIAKLEIKGDFLSENKLINGEILQNNFSGKAKLQISNLKKFYQTYINSNDFFAKNLQENSKAVNISSDINLQNQELEISNLTFNSSLFDGNGAMIFSKKPSQVLVIDLILNLENLDLENLLQKQERTKQDAQNITPQQIQNKLEDKIDKTLNLSNSRKIDFSGEVNIKKIKFLNGEIKDANLYLESAEGKNILIMPLTFNIPGQGFMRLSGVLDNSLNSSKFIGKIDGSGENLGEFFKFIEFYPQNLKVEALGKYSFYSNVLLTSNRADFHNLYFKLGKDNSEFLGRLKVNDAYKKLAFDGDFRISNFNIEEYFFTSSRNTYLSVGSLLKKLLWLNNIGSSGSFNLNFDKLIYKEEVFRNQITQINFDAGFFEIAKIKLDSENIKLSGALLADIRGNNPKFNLEIIGEKFNYETPEAGTFEEKSSQKKRNIFNQIYELPSLEDFSGKVNIAVENLNIDDFVFSNFKLAGNLQQGLINNCQASLQAIGGELDYKGVLGVKLQKTLNGNVIFQSVNLKDFLTKFFKIGNIDGTANIAASITSIASNKEDFLNNLNLSMKISANAPSVEGYGINDLVRKMFLAKNYLQELRNPEAILFNQEITSTFKQARANLEMKAGEASKFKIDVSAPALNGVLSGSFDFKDLALDSTFNAIFVTGNKKKQVPINIVSNIKGSKGEFLHSSNLDQVKQYLGIDKKEKPAALLPAQEKSENLNIEKTLLMPEKLEEVKPQMFQVPLQ